MVWLYYLLKFSFWHCLHIFYRAIHILNINNVPKEGPTIIYSNHRNYIVDGMVHHHIIENFIIALKRPVRVVVASITIRKPGIGHMIRWSGAIGVERPQDVFYKNGKGLIKSVKNNCIYG
jgi:glycerol-3-phosphate O-acyltransferase / dihydroxyacetone phosphate acyltransferase